MKTRSFPIKESLFYSWGQRKQVPHGQKQKNMPMLFRQEIEKVWG